MTFFLILQGQEIDITPSIADTVQPWDIRFLISGRGDHGITPQMAAGEHQLGDICGALPVMWGLIVNTSPHGYWEPYLRGMRHAPRPAPSSRHATTPGGWGPLMAGG